jgi:hypothetical protein
VALVEVRTGEGSLGCGDDRAVSASHAGRELLSNSAATVAKTEGVAANADDSTVVGARSAVCAGRGAGSDRRSRSDGSSRGDGSRRCSRLGSSRCGSNRRRGSTRREESRNARGGNGSSRVGRRRSHGSSRVCGSSRRDRSSGVGGCGRAGSGLSSSRSRWTSTSSGRAKLSLTSTQLGHGSAASTAELGTKVRAVAVGDRGTGIRVVEVLVLRGAARGVGKVGNEHVGESSKSSGDRFSGCSITATNLDRSAVHVELTVPDFVQPGPSESVLAVWDALGHCDREGSSTVTVRVRWRDVTGDVGRAAADNTMDDLPLRRLIRLGICCKGELARATTVDGGTDE